jgi:hypothetical protein
MRPIDRTFRWILVLGFAVGTWTALGAETSWTASAPQAAQPAQAEALETWEQFQGPEAENYLRRARIRRMTPIGKGVTLPNMAELDLDGVRRRAVFKDIDTRSQGITQMSSGKPETHFQDSWQLEIPAYYIDRVIGLKLVPATVERSVNGKLGSLQWFVQSMMSEAERRKQGVAPTDEEKWNQVYLRMQLFDQLIYNVDRHLNNILVTKDFDLRLIDHSRSFRPFRELQNPGLLTRFSRSLLEGLKKLEYQDLRKNVGRYLIDSQIKTVLARRDAILALAEERIKEKGEAAVIYP